MLAITTTNGLAVVDSASLKKTSLLPTQQPLATPPCATSWTPDHDILFLSSSHDIHRYGPSQKYLSRVYQLVGDNPISNAVAKDSDTVAFSVGELIHILDCNPQATPRIMQSFNSHITPVTSLSISNDATLLASTSTGAIHVHNLILGSHTNLRGLKPSGHVIDVCVFHPHVTTRLLVAFAKQLVVYDTTKPLAPARAIALTGFGKRVVSVTCSPFSKTLVAVASVDGLIGLVDLDKEKGLFRTLDLGTPINACEFSPEGASMYVGTEAGRLLIVDLRGLDKPPREIYVSEGEYPIQTISVQRKSKISSADSSNGRPGAVTKTAVQVENRKTMPLTSSPARKAPNSPARTHHSTSSSQRVPLSKKEGVSNVPTVLTIAKTRKNYYSGEERKTQIRSPTGKGVGVGSGGKYDIKSSVLVAQGPTSPKVSNIRTKSTVPRSPTARSAMHTRDGSGGSSASTEIVGEFPARRVRAAPSSLSNAVPATNGGVAEAAGEERKRTKSSSSVTESLPATGSVPEIVTTRPGSRASAVRDILTSGPKADVLGGGSGSSSNDIGRVRAGSTSSGRTTATKSSAHTRGLATPEPELPGLEETEDERQGEILQPQRPTTPVTPPSRGKGAKSQAGAGGKNKGNSVGFGGLDYEGSREARGDREKGLAMQLSPLRPGRGSAAASSNMWMPSPLQNAMHSKGVGGNGAQDMLKGLVRDAMYEYHEETRGQLLGLHMDVIRMNSGFKQELKGMMEEYLGELRELREENKRLREENDKLRQSRI